MTATATAGGVLDVERFLLSALADETTVTLPLTVTSLPGLDHVNSWIQAMPRAAEYFKTLD